MILHDLRDRYNIFTKFLRSSVTIQSHHGTLPHNDIIRKRVGDIVESSKGVPMRIHEPKLDQYVLEPFWAPPPVQTEAEADFERAFDAYLNLDDAKTAEARGEPIQLDDETVVCARLYFQAISDVSAHRALELPKMIMLPRSR